MCQEPPLTLEVLRLSKEVQFYRQMKSRWLVTYSTISKEMLRTLGWVLLYYLTLRPGLEEGPYISM